jgi:Icc-related predicted phosphoesterase
MSDLHGSESVLRESRQLWEEHSPDLFIVTGDITNFGPLSYAKELFRDLPVKTFAIPGNCDPRDIVPLLEGMGVSLHRRKETFKGKTFVGLGGSSPTPFRTPFELSEEEILVSLKPLMVRGAILATHSPPKGHVDFLEWSGHVGSDAVKRIVDEYKPKLVLCGHIHEARGVEGGAVTFVNPGPAYRGYAALIDLEDEVKVTLLP